MRVSIIIPFRDKVSLLIRCVESIIKKTSYQEYEIILVNNKSRKRETEDYLIKIKENEKIRVLDYNKEFNFSAINNFAVESAQGDYLLFLNNDTEVISSNWLIYMLNSFKAQDVGAVGAQLLYPNRKIQHIGIMFGESALAFHVLRKERSVREEFNLPLEWGAVTAACMMTEKSLFQRLDGFDELNLPIAYNDVDYCLRLRALGYRVVCDPSSKLYHYESASRGSDVLAKFFNYSRYKKFSLEQEYFRNKWKEEILNNSCRVKYD